MRFKTKRNLIKIKHLISQGLQIIVGTAVLAMGISLFLLPNQLSSGGFSGLATVFYYLFKIPVGTIVLLLNIPLFIIAFLKNGRRFFWNALTGTIFLSIFLNIFGNLRPFTTDRFLGCIYGGIFVGIGTAIVLKANASTGGTDLLASIVRNYKPTIKSSNFIVGLDIIIVILNIIFFKELEIGLYSAITIYIDGKIIDIFFEGINFAKMIYIISDKYQEISDRISKDMRRGNTLLYGKGMYKKEDKNVLMCVVSRREVSQIRKIINEIDQNSFVVITNAREVFGKGFKQK